MTRHARSMTGLVTGVLLAAAATVAAASPQEPASGGQSSRFAAVVTREGDLVVLDAQNVDRAPLATVTLSHRVPFGFHGNWAAGI